MFQPHLKLERKKKESYMSIMRMARLGASCQTLLVPCIRRAARKVLITINQTPAQRTRITPRLKGCLDNAPRRPRGPQYVHLGTLLQGRLPKVGLGLVLAPVQDFWCRLP